MTTLLSKKVADPMQPELVNLLNAATTRNLTLPAATPPSDARPRTTVLGSSRMPARQRRLRHLHGVSFRRMSSLARCWLSLQLADEEMPVWYQEGPAHSANPEWEIDGARIAKKDAAIEKCEVRQEDKGYSSNCTKKLTTQHVFRLFRFVCGVVIMALLRRQS